MNSLQVLTRVGLFLFSLVFLSGCGGDFFRNTGPSNVGIIELDAGETLRLSVAGPAPIDREEGDDVVYQWSVSIDGVDFPPCNCGATDVLEFDFLARPEYVDARLITISLLAIVGPDSGAVVIKRQQTMRWKVRVGVVEQTPPEWIGNMYVTNEEELALVQGYSDVTQDLVISYSGLNTLEGLGAIERVGRDVHVLDNYSSESIQSLNGLNIQYIGRNLSIKDNWLVTLEGLESLDTLNGELVLNRNSQLKDVNGLNNVSAIAGRLYIHQNSQLTNLTGLENLARVDGDFWISQNRNLCSTDATNLETQVVERGGIGGITAVTSNTGDCE